MHDLVCYIQLAMLRIIHFFKCLSVTLDLFWLAFHTKLNTCSLLTSVVNKCCTVVDCSSQEESMGNSVVQFYKQNCFSVICQKSNNDKSEFFRSNGQIWA